MYNLLYCIVSKIVTMSYVITNSHCSIPYQEFFVIYIFLFYSSFLTASLVDIITLYSQLSTTIIISSDGELNESINIKICKCSVSN